MAGRTFLCYSTILDVSVDKNWGVPTQFFGEISMTVDGEL
jgi:hypothetical protein